MLRPETQKISGSWYFRRCRRLFLMIVSGKFQVRDKVIVAVKIPWKNLDCNIQPCSIGSKLGPTSKNTTT